ncbi:urease accessory protein UreD [Neobacillus notoginsengisoli]|uniref:Urease accessory protein UreD n=1 Tax=Neobacillus notoginsengisoli TaxID=1578198 RepID=A0A417YSX4_9BACI|nr:urease accessory protein UreD [Neobacillus notoginsengisoli]RHW39091.1 urease accessory protein UreD [Neobacillus notoginsengisoli]
MDQMTGVLDMELIEKKGRTIANRAFFKGALKVMRPFYLEDNGHVCYYILNPGGGYLDGDRYHIRVSLKDQAQATLTTQSSTKVYKTPKDHAYQVTEVFLKDKSYLEFLPDPLIAYKDAKYKQKNVFHLDGSSALLYSDILTPGWSPEGEDFSYDTLQLINEVYVDEKLLLYDHVKLQPGKQDMNSLGFMEGTTHLGSMIVVGEQTTDELIDKIYESLCPSSDEYRMGISRLAVPGFTIRILSNNTQIIEQAFNKCHRLIRNEWFGNEPASLRKY